MVKDDRMSETSYLQQYIELKCLCIELLDKSSEKCVIIRDVLHLYAETINSSRASETIDSGSSLLKLLEKRNLLSCLNVDPLHVITKQIGDSDSLLKKINTYKRELELGDAPNFPNYYDHLRRPVLPPQGFQSTKNDHGDISNLDDLIYEAVSESIGTNWKSMARYLSIKENDIDNLETKYHSDITAIVSEVFNKYRKKYPKNWKRDVCKALEKSRRSDLRDVLEDIMNNYDSS